MASEALRRHLDEYYAVHRHPMNRLTHKIAIPLIVFHVLAMLDWVALPVQLGTIAGRPYMLSLAHLFFAGSLGWYLTLSPRLAAILAVLFAPCLVLSALTPWYVTVAIAIGAWVVQLAGHAVWEKKSPAFFANLLQLLVGPLFFVALLTGDYRLPEGEPSPA